MSVVTYSDGHRVFQSVNKVEVNGSIFNTRNGPSISLASHHLSMAHESMMQYSKTDCIAFATVFLKW